MATKTDFGEDWPVDLRVSLIGSVKGKLSVPTASLPSLLHGQPLLQVRAKHRALQISAELQLTHRPRRCLDVLPWTLGRANPAHP